MSALFRLRVSFSVLCASAVFVAPAVRADLIQLDTGLSLVWDRGASPANSSNLTIQITNETVPPGNLFNGWQLSLQFIPQSGATGTLQANAVSNPAGNALSNPDPPSMQESTDANRGVYTSIVNANGDSTQNAGTGNLVNLNFSTPDNAAGLFNLVAVNQAASSSIFNPLGTLWIDSSANVYAFSNPGIGFADGASLVLGTINVQAPAGVPEPGSFLLLTLASGVLGGYGWRRKRRTV